MADVLEDLAAAIDVAALLAVWDRQRVWASDGSLTAAARLVHDTHCSVTAARIELRRARHLAAMPAVSVAVREGVLSLDLVDVLGRADQPWRHRLFADAEAGLVDTCSSLWFPDAVRTVTYWCDAVDAVSGDERAEHHRDNAHVWASTTLDGNVVVDGMLDPVSGEIFTRELNRLERQLYLADHKTGVDRKGSQRRVAALVEMATRSATMRKHGRRPQPLFIAQVGDATVAKLCELGSGTVIRPSDVVAHIDAAVIQSVLFDGPSTMLSVSNRRTFTGALRTAIAARDRHCQHPSGCERPADECDVDHIVAYPDLPRTGQFTGRIECPSHNRDPARHDFGAEPFPERPVTYLDALRARLKWRYLHDQAHDEQQQQHGAA